MTIPQVSAPMAEWALKNGVKQVYTVVADYGPGHRRRERSSPKTFKAGGGEVVGTLRTPLQNPDFSAAIQRVKDAKPQAVFVFLPAGEQGIAFVKGFNERGLAQAGIKLIATGDITDDHVLDAMGEPTLGTDHGVPLFGRARFAGERGVPEGLRGGQRRQAAAAELHGGGAATTRMAAIYEASKKTQRLTSTATRRWRRMKGMQVDEPARAGDDRSGDARHRADGVHPQGREEGRQARQRRVRQASPNVEGSGQVDRPCIGRRPPMIGNFIGVLFDGIAYGSLLFIDQHRAVGDAGADELRQPRARRLRDGRRLRLRDR